MTLQLLSWLLIATGGALIGYGYALRTTHTRPPQPHPTTTCPGCHNTLTLTAHYLTITCNSCGTTTTHPVNHP